MKTMEDVEPCAGCGEMSAFHPMIGIKRDPESGKHEAYPVCHDCWMAPSHRKHKLKMHFFDKKMKQLALDCAGRGDIG